MTALEVAEFPAASQALAVNECPPFAKIALLKDAVYGLVAV
jgi:hypothetical protein